MAAVTAALGNNDNDDLFGDECVCVHVLKTFNKSTIDDISGSISLNQIHTYVAYNIP